VNDHIQLKTGNNLLGVLAGTNLITFTVNQGNIDHGSIGGLGDNDHSQYPLKASAETITGGWQWSTPLLPTATDTYDIGSATKLWRKGWLSELESILFVENSIQVTGGWWMVPHAAGTLAADVPAEDVETNIDFGTAMTINDFLLLRGNGQVEHMQIASHITGTIYAATRDLDGSGGNAWPKGHVWVNLGYTGNGRIEFDAQTAGPRMSVFTQGSSYNTQTERVRIGDLTGWESAGLTGYGWAAGDYSAGKYAYYDPTAGLVVSGNITATGGSFSGVIAIGTSGGIYQGSGSFGTPTTGLKIWNDSGIGRIASYNAGTLQVGFGTDGKLYAGAGDVKLDNDGIWLNAGGYKRNQIVWVSGGENIGGIYTTWAGESTDYVETVLRGWDLVSGCGTRVNIAALKGYPTITQDNRWIVWSEGFCSTSGDIRLSGGISVGSESVNPAPGEVILQSNLIIEDPSAGYGSGVGDFSMAGHEYVQGKRYKYQSGAWREGWLVYVTDEALNVWSAVIKAVGNYTVDTSAVGVPAGVKACKVRWVVNWPNGAPSGSTFAAVCHPSYTAAMPVIVRKMVVGVGIEGHGWVSCDANGDFMFRVSGEQGTNITLDIYGYAL
jgi:hypothetical protein